MKCGRCRTPDIEVWASIEMFSRRGNTRDILLCQHCADVATAFILNRPSPLEDTMTIDWYTPLFDPLDVDDAEHPALCECMECCGDLIDFRTDQRRDQRKLA